MPSAAHVGRWSSRLSFALCAFAYLYVSPSYPKINNPNENVRLYMTAAIVEQGRYEIDGMRARWGWVNDAAKHGGHLYSVKAPGTSLLGVPAYAIYRTASDDFDRERALWWCRVFASVLPALGFLYLFRRFLARTDAPAFVRECAFVSVAFGSLLYGYALLFVSHTSSAAAAALALFAITAADRQTARQRTLLAFAAGFLSAAVTWLEYPGLPTSLALSALAAVCLRRTPSALLAFAAGALLPTLSVMHFQWRAFDNPLTPGHLFVETRALRERHHEGLYGAVGVSAEALYGLLFAPGAGLFPLTPLLVFALPGFGRLIREPKTRAAGITALVISVGTVLAIASMNNWRGGWTIGPRYLAVTVPFMAWAAVAYLGRLWHRMPRLVSVVAFAATLVALCLSGLPSVYYPHLPPELTHPVGQLLPALVAADLAPRTAANLLGVYGNASMLPLLLCGALSLGHCVALLPSRLRAWSGLGALLGIGLCLVLSHPFGLSDAQANKAAGAVSFITRTWSPQPPSNAAPSPKNAR